MDVCVSTTESKVFAIIAMSMFVRMMHEKTCATQIRAAWRQRRAVGVHGRRGLRHSRATFWLIFLIWGVHLGQL